MDIKEIDDTELIDQANLVAELNLMKQTSSQLLDQDKKRQTMLKSNMSTDRHIDTQTVLETKSSVEKLVDEYIASGKVTGEAAEKYRSKQQFKAMKGIHKINERATYKKMAKR